MVRSHDSAYFVRDGKYYPTTSRNTECRPSYSDVEIEPRAPYLALLGDIGYVSDDRLITFLETQLRRFDIVFFLMGNHEPYGIPSEMPRPPCCLFLSVLQDRLSDCMLGHFVFLKQTRYDLGEDLTVLGCTLFSDIAAEQRDSIKLFLTDFDMIENWTVEDHCAAHASDVAWLNDQVNTISKQEPNRVIVIFTHHSLTTLQEANDPTHSRDAAQVRSGFTTDLSNQDCWLKPQVKLWAFGHTHSNCDFRDSWTGKRVFTNQKGYRRNELDTYDYSKVVDIAPSATKQSGRRERKRTKCSIF